MLRGMYALLTIKGLIFDVETIGGLAASNQADIHHLRRPAKLTIYAQPLQL